MIGIKVNVKMVALLNALVCFYKYLLASEIGEVQLQILCYFCQLN